MSTIRKPARRSGAVRQATKAQKVVSSASIDLREATVFTKGSARSTKREAKKQSHRGERRLGKLLSREGEES